MSVERLWHIHDASHRVKRVGDGWFACANFHPVGEPDAKRYDVDLRLAARDGKLEVIEAVIHQEAAGPHALASSLRRFPRSGGRSSRAVFHKVSLVTPKYS